MTSQDQPTIGVSGTRRWQLFVRIIVFGIPVIAAIPTALTAYQSFKNGIPFGEVSYRLKQWELWNKNAECAANLHYRDVTTDRAQISVAACKDTGDIALRISVSNGRSINEWIAFDRLGRSSESNSLWNLLVAAVRADDAPSGGSDEPGRSVSLAQLQVVCQSRPDRTKIVRIVNEGGRCYRETFSPFLGRVEQREEVPCNTPCPT